MFVHNHGISYCPEMHDSTYYKPRTIGTPALVILFLITATLLALTEYAAHVLYPVDYDWIQKASDIIGSRSRSFVHHHCSWKQCYDAEP